MPITLNTSTEGDVLPQKPQEVHSSFGVIPLELATPASLEEAYKLNKMLNDRLWNEGFPRSDEAKRDVQELVTQIQLLTGGVHHYLFQNLFEIDIPAAIEVTDSYWKCFLYSVFTRRFHPLKYHRICTSAPQNYTSMVLMLSNLMNHHDVNKEQVRSVLQSRTFILQREREYREAALMIVQIGIGYCGMLAGIIGLLVSIVVTLFA